MKRKVSICLLIGITLIPGFRLSAQELRTGIDFDRMISPKVEILSKVQIRKSIPGQNSWYTIAQLGMEYKLFKQVSIAASFRYSMGPSEIGEYSNPFRDKMRFTADAKVRSKRFDNGISIRYRLRYHHSSTWEGNSRDYLRNKLLLDYKFNKEMSPYAAAELYFRLGEMEFQKLRLYLGTDIKFFKRNLELSYILEGDIDATYFRSYHMMGLFFRL